MGGIEFQEVCVEVSDDAQRNVGVATGIIKEGFIGGRSYLSLGRNMDVGAQSVVLVQTDR